ncbi:PH domain-containing protein [Nocardioides sp.]|uniref:PH domain-containing protein n=1 Tax=Nocardioides sp. TaxID=35761 RepID=UPI002ED9AF8A
MQLFIVVSTVAGLAFVVAAVRTGAWGALLLGGFFLTGAASFRLSMFGRRSLGKRVRETWDASGFAIRVGLRPHRPLALLCTALSTAMMFGTGVLLLESPEGKALMWVLLPLPLLLVPDSVRGLLATGREVVLTPRAIIYRGWSYDIEVPWEDIERVRSTRSNPWVPAIRFDLRPSSSERAVMHKFVAWLDPKPRPDNFQIPVLAVDMPWELVALAARMVCVQAHQRPAQLREHGMPTLTNSGV